MTRLERLELKTGVGVPGTQSQLRNLLGRSPKDENSSPSKVRVTPQTGALSHELLNVPAILQQHFPTPMSRGKTDNELAKAARHIGKAVKVSNRSYFLSVRFT